RVHIRRRRRQAHSFKRTPQHRLPTLSALARGVAVGHAESLFLHEIPGGRSHLAGRLLEHVAHRPGAVKVASDPTANLLRQVDNRLQPLDRVTERTDRALTSTSQELARRNVATARTDL